MKFFDLHSDTITECYSQNKSLTNNDLHISLERGQYLEKWIQVFAIWIPDKIRGNDAEEYYEKILCKFREEIKNAHNVTPILAVEGGAVLNGKLENVERLSRDGVKIITITWKGDNELASGSFSETDKGLTPFGKEAVSEMVKYGIVPDVSHLGEKSFYDLCKFTDFPFIASHSNAYSVNPHVRNLKDEQIKEIVRRKGLIGLNFYNTFLGEGNSQEMLIRHAEHILNLCGENVLAMGSDFDGCSINPEIRGIEKMGSLYDCFCDHFGKTLTEKIFFENAERYFNSQVFTK